jgi:hypothetical protein
MQTETIITTLLSAAAFLKTPVQEAATQSIKDLFATATYYLKKKFGDGSAATKALELATEKPESAARKAVLIEETESASLETDDELLRMIERLAALLPNPADSVRQNVRITGRSNRVHVAGGDIITAERHVYRNVITPGEGHLNADQRKRISALIAQLADRLAGDDGRPRFGAAHAILQHRYSVLSYLLIPAEKFEDAVSFLTQQRAIHRSRLRRRNPVAYEADFLRAIHARRVELGWVKPQLYAFAMEKLGLKKPLTSLTSLGPIQLKSLVELMRRQSSCAAAR